MDQGPFGMTRAEDLVLATATVLAVAALVERRIGALSHLACALLVALALLAAAMAILHMEVRVLATR